MASPMDAIPDVAQQVLPLATKLSSEPLILATIIVIITASLTFTAAWLVYRLLTRRDKGFEDLAAQANAQNVIMAKVVQIQEIDHNNTLRNRDLLLEVPTMIGRLENTILLAIKDIGGLGNNLDRHAKDCADRDKSRSTP